MAGHNSIVMKKSDFLKEHRKLIKLLNMGKKLVAEAEEQQAEMAKYITKKK